MTANMKLPQGTAEWFEMVGTVMSEAASQAALTTDLDVSLLERYCDGVELSEGLLQGIRFEVVSGKPSFRIGARRDESADITIEVTAAAARELNTLRSSDPAFQAATTRFLETGEMRVHGDLCVANSHLAHRHPL